MTEDGEIRRHFAARVEQEMLLIYNTDRYSYVLDVQKNSVQTKDPYRPFKTANQWWKRAPK